MSANLHHFELESSIKALIPILNGEQVNILTSLVEQKQELESAVELHNYFNDQETRESIKHSLRALLKTEKNANSILSSIFISTEPPEQASGRWDGGKERKHRQNILNSTASLREQISTLMLSIKQNLLTGDSVIVAPEANKNELAEASRDTITLTTKQNNHLNHEEENANSNSALPLPPPKTRENLNLAPMPSNDSYEFGSVIVSDTELAGFTHFDSDV